MRGGVSVKAAILTLDNLDLLQQQIEILRDEPLIQEIVVVDNGSRDGTGDWLRAAPGLRSVLRRDRSPGRGRNAAIDAAGEFDFLLSLDGGIRPLRGGVAPLLEYLATRRDVQLVGVETGAMVTDPGAAQEVWSEPVTATNTYQHQRLSLMAYALAHRSAFSPWRYNEIGPFGVAGWGVDDDEMASRWRQAGVVVHATTAARPYRRAGGSFQRLYEESGIWPNQYGSVYEERLVWCQQNWPQFHHGVQRGEPWLTLIIQTDQPVERSARLIKRAHDELRKRQFTNGFPNPYSIVAWCPPGHAFVAWAAPRQLRQHHGNVLIDGDRLIRRTLEAEALWTGDFRVWTGPVAGDALRTDAHFFALVASERELEDVLRQYNQLHPHRDIAPDARHHQLHPKPSCDIEARPRPALSHLPLESLRHWCLVARRDALESVTPRSATLAVELLMAFKRVLLRLDDLEAALGALVGHQDGAAGLSGALVASIESVERQTFAPSWIGEIRRLRCAANAIGDVLARELVSPAAGPGEPTVRDVAAAEAHAALAALAAASIDLQFRGVGHEA